MMDTTVSIFEMVDADPSLVIKDSDRLEQLIQALKDNAEKINVDLSTDRGRKAIASAARKVASRKTAIDAAGKEINEAARAEIGKVDAVRRRVKEELDAIRDQIRRPLNQWEEQESARVEWCKNTIQGFSDAAAIREDDTSKSVMARLERLRSTDVSNGEFQEYFERAEAAKNTAEAALQSAAARLEKEESDHAELEALRAQRAEQDRIDQERAAREQAEKAEAERKEREAEAAKHAAEQARLNAEQRAKAEMEAKEAEHKAELERIRQAQIKADQDRRAATERAQAEADKKAAEELRRQADQDHRQSVVSDASKAIEKECGVPAKKASEIVSAIISGSIPNISIRF